MLFQLAQHRVRPHAKHTGIPKETARFQILPGELKRGLFDKAHRALAIGLDIAVAGFRRAGLNAEGNQLAALGPEEHTSELQSLMRSSYAVFCLKKKS